MRNRPWPIILLALAHALAPLGNVIYSTQMEGISLQTYLHDVVASGQVLAHFLHYLLLPLAGWAIYKTNRWSYPIYLCVMAWSFYTNYENWRDFPEFFGFKSLVFSYAFNVSLVSYFLIPAVREVYFNPKIRWWENKPRYDVSLPVRLESLERVTEGTVTNISEGGVFIEAPITLFLKCPIQLKIKIPDQVAGGQELSLAAEVMHARRAQPVGYGIQFRHNPESLAETQKLIKQLRSTGAIERIGNIGAREEFLSWLGHTLRTGRGLIPEVKRLSALEKTSIPPSANDKAA